jgi:uncharacterized protein
VKTLLVVLVGVVAVTLVAAWVFQRRLIYLPSSGPVGPARDHIEGALDITLETADGLHLGAWYVPPSRRNVVVLVANGNAGDRSLRAPLATALAREGLGVLLFDYRGYGGNEGHPTEEGLALDVRSAHRFLTEEEGISSDQLLYYGESLGAAVAVELATEHPPGGLLLRSPFTDLAEVGKVHYPFLPVSALLWDRYPVRDGIARVDVPTVVVYGTDDSIVPPDQSRTVAEEARGPTTVIEVEGAGHNDSALLNGRELIDATVRLAERIESRR